MRRSWQRSRGGVRERVRSCVSWSMVATSRWERVVEEEEEEGRGGGVVGKRRPGEVETGLGVFAVIHQQGGGVYQKTSGGIYK